LETKEKIDILKKLQGIDRELAHYRRMKEYEPKRLADQQARVAAQEARLKELGDKHSQIQREMSRKELDVKARQEKINRLKSQMVAGGKPKMTNREYQAFLKEVGIEEVEKSRVEDEIIELMVGTEGLAAEEKTIKDAIAAAKDQIEKVSVEVKAALAEAVAKEEELAGRRREVAALLDADTLRKYEGLFRSRNSEAVVSATFEAGSGGEEGQYLCRGCFLPLTHQMLNLLMIGKDIITCKSCGRILYIEDHKETE
jgi:predicted  nucleic acid-binding Zn-ribbon protein